MDHTELKELKADLKRMQARVDELEASTPEQPVNRRNMLRGLGAAAVGAAAGGLAFAHPAAATDGNSLIIGNDTQTSSSPTGLIASGAYSSSTTGIFHVSDDAASTGVFTSCITAAATNNGAITAFAGKGSTYGAKLDAPIPLKLLDQSGTAALSTTVHTGAMVIIDGNLYLCVDHTPGILGTASNSQWRRITGPAEAGSYHPVTPARVYSSVFSSPAFNRPLAAGTRTISVANSVNTGSGVTVTPNFVPAGATAVVANVTITQTVGAGFIAVNPGGVSAVTASVANWTTSGVTVANGITLALNTNRQLTAVVGGAPGCQTNFIIDVFGYYM